MNGLADLIALSQIPKFEKQNPSLSINVLEFDDIVFPLHITDTRDRNRVSFLLIANEDGDQHYCLIRNLSRLLGKRTHHNGQSYFNNCLHAFTKQSLLNDHIAYGQPNGPQRIKVVDEQNKWLMLTKRVHQQRVPFVIYVDFQCSTAKVNTCMPDPDTPYTHTHLSNPQTIRMLLSSGMRSFQVYRGRNVIEIFIDRLRECEKHITTIHDNHVPMNLTHD